MKTEDQQSIVIHGARDNCTVSLRKGETIRLDVGSVSLNTTEALEFCDTLKSALVKLLEAATNENL